MFSKHFQKLFAVFRLFSINHLVITMVTWIQTLLRVPQSLAVIRTTLESQTVEFAGENRAILNDGLISSLVKKD